jgi:hypothetical protein
LTNKGGEDNTFSRLNTIHSVLFLNTTDVGMIRKKQRLQTAILNTFKVAQDNIVIVNTKKTSTEI